MVIWPRIKVNKAPILNTFKYPMDVLQIQHFSQVFFTTADMTYYELDLVHGKSVVSGGLK